MDRQAEFLSHFLQKQDEIRAVIASLVRDRVLCDDLFQEVALVLWKKYDTYDGTRPFGAWARGIAVNKVMQAFDRNRRTPVSLSPDVVETLVDAFDRTEGEEPDDSQRREALQDCIRKLPDKSRRLLELRYDRALKLHEMADSLGAKLDAVHKALSRLRDRLKKCIEDHLALAR